MERKHEERAKEEEEESVEGREKRLYEASVTGSVSSLKQLMARDPLTLARAAVTCFNETPLHVAALLGHLDFANYLLTHKPDMTMALDLRGRSPLHLASANGYVEMVNILLSANPDCCLIRDEDGRTPLHLAVMKGQVEIARKLVEARPQAARYKLDQGETILHSAVKQNRLGVLKVLVELVGEVEFVNSKVVKQFETTEYLVERPEMEVNAVNGNGFTALDIIQHMPRDLKGMEIRESLFKAGALSSRSKGHKFMGESGITMVIENPQLPPPPVAVLTEGKTETPLGGGGMKIRENKKDWMEKKRDALMVAATLIAGMTFQVAVNPPGGVWNEYSEDKTMLAGTSIFAQNDRYGYELVMAFNTMSFLASLSIVFLVVSGVPFVKSGILMWVLMIVMWITLTFMALTYLYSMMATSPSSYYAGTISPSSYDAGTISPSSYDAGTISQRGHELPDISNIVRNSVYAWWGVLAIVALVHIIRFLVWCVRKVVRCVRKVGKANISCSRVS